MKVNYNKHQGGDWNADEENYTEPDTDMTEGKKGGRASSNQEDKSDDREDNEMESQDEDFSS